MLSLTVPIYAQSRRTPEAHQDSTLARHKVPLYQEQG